ncbi:hypothetical protein [Aliiglaciecola sp. M165]|uniref:hypothetical protein n=1 Tax=Aliiglaciecola sp. M165 TaxID=2593649 RepID=UPI00118053AA|nr:hypothetical protein [Aliiglaciecola sp. M165]TRY29768.1 hypothetical protein FM019_16485 [Aliiglaciecola sp. M165]
MSFERYKLFEYRSLAHRLFKRHHTHFNDIYWSQRIANRHVFSLTKPYKRDDSITLLFNPTTDEIRNSRSLGEWADWYSDFDRWSRLASIVGLAGYLETYIAQVSVAAFESTPSLVLGGGPKVDGAVFLKHNANYDLYQHSESLTRGDWQARVSAYKGFFGSCPFENLISELEKLRILRNDAGHSFGRDIKSMRFAQGWEVKKLANISDSKIIDFLKLVESVANSIDSHIAEEYVGQYEIIKVYHQWLPTLENANRYAQKERAKKFRKYFFELTSGIYSPALKMMDYYDSL